MPIGYSKKIETVQKAAQIASIAKTEADLQRLNLDPQTKANLTAVLNNQNRQGNIELNDNKNLQSTVSLSEILLEGNSMARKSNSISRIITPMDSYQNITAKPIQNGNPQGGWSAFHLFIKKQMGQKGFLNYHAIVSFDLDKEYRPIHIDIKSSSNSEFNKDLIDILKIGPKWENKDPNHPIFIRLNSEDIDQF